MKKLGHFFERVFKFMASLQLAMIIMTSLTILSAVGTIVEARYDAAYAQKVIYHSPWMYLTLALLCVNLFNVMVDRWPWKPHHAGFVFAHIGIIMLILGALVTRLYGVDGSMSVDIGQKSRFVMLQDTELVAFASYGDGAYKSVYASPVDFFKNPPAEKPFSIQLDGQELKVKDYYNWALREQKVVESTNPFDGPGVRIQLQNANVNLAQWIVKGANSEPETLALGPATVVLMDKNTPYQYTDGNVIVLRAMDSEKVKYEIYTKSKGGKTKSGELRLAEAVETGWMGLQMRLLKYLPRAQFKTEYIKKDKPSGMTTSALLVEFNGQQQWIGLNTNVRLFTDNVMFLLSYRNRLVDIGFDLELKNFNVGRYQGTRRAMSYESLVVVPNVGDVVISMNEPLKHNGYTFYQASFQENEQGQATTSIFSVNKDPGRWIKYLGSFLIVLGTIVMFYFKHYRVKIFGDKSAKA